jgi:hypothetical protein
LDGWSFSTARRVDQTDAIGATCWKPVVVPGFVTPT